MLCSTYNENKRQEIVARLTREKNINTNVGVAAKDILKAFAQTMDSEILSYSEILKRIDKPSNIDFIDSALELLTSPDVNVLSTVFVLSGKAILTDEQAIQLAVDGYFTHNGEHISDTSLVKTFYKISTEDF